MVDRKVVSHVPLLHPFMLDLLFFFYWLLILPIPSMPHPTLPPTPLSLLTSLLYSFSLLFSPCLPVLSLFSFLFIPPYLPSL